MYVGRPDKYIHSLIQELGFEFGYAQPPKMDNNKQWF